MITAAFYFSDGQKYIRTFILHLECLDLKVNVQVITVYLNDMIVLITEVVTLIRCHRSNATTRSLITHK